MNMQKPLKCAAAVLSAILVFSSTTGMTTAETTLGGSEREAASVTAEADINDSSEAKSEGAGWWKAEITDYDSSLSLISYETPPELTQTEENEETEEIDETATESEEDTVVKSPVPVESQTTGGAVGNIPQAKDEPVINAQSGQFAFTTYGWGHGVGMSQNGANFYATYSGWTYQDILFHYYPGTYLMNTGTAQSEKLTVGGVSGDTLSMVAGVVYREIGSSMSYEAIKAQAVAVYSYIKYNGNNGNDLRCKANPPQNVINACSEVLGQALYYGDSYALTMFSASSGGTTANCYDVFTADLPYLRSVTSDYDASLDPHYGTVKYYSSSEVKRLVEARYGITLSENPANWIQPIVGDSGYNSYVVIDGQITVRGYDLKLCLNLKSSKFDVIFVQ